MKYYSLVASFERWSNFNEMTKIEVDDPIGKRRREDTLEKARNKLCKKKI